MRELLFILLLLSQQVFAGHILTTHGYKEDSKVKVGDSIISCKGFINIVQAVRVMNKDWYTEKDLSFQYYIFNLKYQFFKDQSIFDGNINKVVHAFEVEIGDTIFSETGKRIIVTNIGISHKNHKWFRFTISGDHSYIEDGIFVHNAARFWIGAGGGANYNTTNWSTTTGGTGGSAAPTSSDDVTFDGAGTNGNTNCTITAAAAALSVTFTSGYTATLTINTTFTWTVSGNFTDNTAHTWTVNGTGALAINAASSINSGGKTFPGPVTFSGANTKTLVTNNWTITGGLTVTATTTINHTTAETLTSAGLNTTGVTSGNISLILSGGTWQGTQGISGVSISIAGNVTVSGTVAYNGTLTYNSGTVTTTGSTLNISGSTTLNTNGISWNNVQIPTVASTTITNNSLFTVTGTLTIADGISVTWAGTSGFNVANLTYSNAGAATQTFKNGITYTVTTSLNAFKSRNGSILTFTSDDGTIKAILTLNQGATCNVLASFTRIDASNGRTIVTFNGTVTTCLNILEKHDYGTITSQFAQ